MSLASQAIHLPGHLFEVFIAGTFFGVFLGVSTTIVLAAVMVSRP